MEKLEIEGLRREVMETNLRLQLMALQSAMELLADEGTSAGMKIEIIKMVLSQGVRYLFTSLGSEGLKEEKKGEVIDIKAWKQAAI